MIKRFIFGIVFLFFIFGFVSSVYSLNISECDNSLGSGYHELNQTVYYTGVNPQCFNLPNDMILDCKGFAIIGDGTGSAFKRSGVPTTLNNNIKNCIIQNFSYGVNIDNSGGNIFENLILKDMTNSAFFISKQSDENIIFNSTFENNYLNIEFFVTGAEPSNNVFSMNKFEDLSKILGIFPNFNSNGNRFYETLSSGEKIGNFWSSINKSSCSNSIRFGYYHICTNPGNYTINVANNVLDPAPLIEYSNKIYSCLDINYPGSYVLNNSIYVENSCIYIYSSNVDLDCNNFNISSNNNPLFVAINISTASNISINNCKIYNFGIGLWAANFDFSSSGSENISFNNLILNNNNKGIYFLRLLNSLINNVLFENVNTGVQFEFSNNNLIKNLIFKNVDLGLDLGLSPVSNNTFFNLDFRDNVSLAIDLNTNEKNHFYANHFIDESQIQNNNWSLYRNFFNTSISGLNLGNYWSKLNYTSCSPPFLSVGPYDICTNPSNYTINFSESIYDFRPLVIDYYNLNSCQNITTSGSYDVSTDILNVLGTGACFDIQVDNVEINCNGKIISSHFSSNKIAFNVFNQSNIKFFNCQVEDFDIGFKTNFSSNVKILNSTLTNNDQSVLALNSDNMLVNGTYFFSDNIDSLNLVKVTYSFFSSNSFQGEGLDLTLINSSNNYFYLNNFSNFSKIEYNDYLDYLNNFSYNLPSGLVVGNYWNDLNCQSSFEYEGYFFCERPYYYSIREDKFIADVAPLVTSIILEARDYSMRLYENSLLDFLVFQSRANYTLRSDYTKENILNHLVLTYDGSNYKVYLNGKLVREESTSYPDYLKYDRVVIGGKENDFKGLVDEIKIYKRAISYEEIQNNYYNFESNSKGCCNYMTLINPNLMGKNSTIYNHNISSSSNVFYDHYNLGVNYNLTVYEIINITSSNTKDNYYNFLVDACMVNAYSVQNFGDLTKILTERNSGDYNFSCSNLVSVGVY